MSDTFDARALLATLPDLPGVYRMLDAGDGVLYVGKAKSLKKRVASYFRERQPSPRIALMVQQIARVETTVTRSEAEALLLENNLIKRLSPRYNILFRDDKSYPYIALAGGDFPRLAYHRGALERSSRYFGPYPSASAVRESIHLLQKMFRLRTCEDSVFANRSRPCLLHQIKRCTAPCVGLITAADYASDVRRAGRFLQGEQDLLLDELSTLMDAAAARLEFEEAARYRDQIQALRQIQSRQFVDTGDAVDADIIVAMEEGGSICINLAIVRGGRHLGDRPHFPGHGEQCTRGEVLTAFLQQHYVQHPVPARILVNLLPDDPETADILAEISGHPVTLALPRQAAHKAWVGMAEQNAELAIVARRTAVSLQEDRLRALADALGLDGVTRIECFDISHTQGEATVASCVVYEGNAMKRADYRRFNIRDIVGGDDYAAMRQAVQRRYEPLAGDGEGRMPDLVLIDGGHGQVQAALQALGEIGLTGLPLLGVAKGEGRRPGLETLIFPDSREPLQLPPEHPALLLIQEIRDEAHRFAISGHRTRRAKPRRASRLEEIPGVGPKRRKALLIHFGGLSGVSGASVTQLMEVTGISHELAQTIYAAFR